MRHVLIAEDEPNLIAVLEELFEYEGFSVTTPKTEPRPSNDYNRRRSPT